MRPRRRITCGLWTETVRVFFSTGTGALLWFDGLSVLLCSQRLWIKTKGLEGISQQRL